MVLECGSDFLGRQSVQWLPVTSSSSLEGPTTGQLCLPTRWKGNHNR